MSSNSPSWSLRRLHTPPALLRPDPVAPPSPEESPSPPPSSSPRSSGGVFADTHGVVLFLGALRGSGERFAPALWRGEARSWLALVDLPREQTEPFVSL